MTYHDCSLSEVQTRTGSEANLPAQRPAWQARQGRTGAEAFPTAATIRMLDRDGWTSRSVAQLLSRNGLKLRRYTSVSELIDEGWSEPEGCVVIDAASLSTRRPELDSQLHLICLRHPSIIVAVDPDVSLVVCAMKAGAVDFLKMPFSNELLLRSLRAAFRLDQQQRAINESDMALRKRFASLSPRERQVLAQVSAGRLNKQIAFDLGLSEVTVKVHRGTMMRKMQARSLPELVRMADALHGPLDRRAALASAKA